jgi:hypothetical protein
MRPMQFNDTYDQAAFGFVRSETQNIEAEVYKIQYPEFNYAALLPVITEGSAWASGTTFYTMDSVGKSEWIGNEARDVPYTDLIRGTGQAPYYMRGAAYRWSLPEINTAAMLGISLAPEKADATRQVMERFLFDLAVSGDTEKAMKGLINWTGVTAADVAANGSGTTTWWANKTPDQILADINTNIQAVRAATNTVVTPNTMLLPDPVFADISTRRISSAGDGAMTILDFLKLKNTYTAMTDQPFTIKPLLELNTADPGGDGRGVLYQNDRKVVRFHLPMPFMFLPVHQKDSLQWEQVGIARTGGTEVRIPKGIIYFDGIWDAP